MGDELDAVLAGEALACGGEHQLGEVDADPGGLGPAGEEIGEHAAVASPKVEDPDGAAGNDVVEDALPFRPAGELAGALEVVLDVVGGGPFLGGHTAKYRPSSDRD